MDSDELERQLDESERQKKHVNYVIEQCMAMKNAKAPTENGYDCYDDRESDIFVKLITSFESKYEKILLLQDPRLPQICEWYTIDMIKEEFAKDVYVKKLINY